MRLFVMGLEFGQLFGGLYGFHQFGRALWVLAHDVIKVAVLLLRNLGQRLDRRGWVCGDTCQSTLFETVAIGDRTCEFQKQGGVMYALGRLPSHGLEFPVFSEVLEALVVSAA